MDQKYYSIAYSESPYGTMNQYMSRTFSWMFAGLLLTFVVAIGTVVSGLFAIIYSTGLIFVLAIAELVLVMALSWKIDKLQPSTAAGMFFVYAIMNGIILSTCFVAYDVPTIIMAFLVGAVYFGIMALYGKRTQKDLTGWGPKLMGALVTFLIFNIAGTLLSMVFHWNFGMMDMIVSAVGLLIFMGFTAYDTQKLKYYYSYYGGDQAMLQKSTVIGALQLYLDYINIFLYVLRILGRNRNND